MQISSRQYRMTYDLYVAAFAGAGITLMALVSDYGSAVTWLQWGTTIALPLMWLGAAESVGDEASPAFVTDDLWTVCSLFLCLSKHKHYNNAVMFGASPDRRCWVHYLYILLHQSCSENSFYFFCLISPSFHVYSDTSCLFLHFLSWPIQCRPPITLQSCGISGERA